MEKKVESTKKVVVFFFAMMAVVLIVAVLLVHFFGEEPYPKNVITIFGIGAIVCALIAGLIVKNT